MYTTGSIARGSKKTEGYFLYTTPTPGPNINKPRVPRPQDTAYQVVIQQKEIEQEYENEPTNDGREMLKLFTHLTSALKDTTKSDVKMPPKFYGDDEKWEGWYKQWRAYL